MGIIISQNPKHGNGRKKYHVRNEYEEIGPRNLYGISALGVSSVKIDVDSFKNCESLERLVGFLRKRSIKIEA